MDANHEQYYNLQLFSKIILLFKVFSLKVMNNFQKLVLLLLKILFLHIVNLLLHIVKITNVIHLN